jgi:hypothetical protein
MKIGFPESSGGDAVRFVDEPTAVEARFDDDGAVHPGRFAWNRNWLDVSDVGRQWTDEAGRHVLVMVANRQTFELVLRYDSLTWWVVRAPDDAAVA